MRGCRNYGLISLHWFRPSIPIGGKTLSPLNSLSLEIKVFQQPFYFVFFVFLILVFYCLVERREEQTHRKRFRNVLATAERTRGKEKKKKKEKRSFLDRIASPRHFRNSKFLKDFLNG